MALFESYEHQITLRTYSFEQKFFSFSVSKDQAYQRAMGALQLLNNNDAAKTSEDFFIHGVEYKNNAQKDIVDIFGENFFQQLNNQKVLDIWLSPIESVYGWHVIKINKVEEKKLSEKKWRISQLASKKLQRLEQQLIAQMMLEFS